MKKVLSTGLIGAATFVLPLFAFAQSLANGDGQAGQIGNFLKNVLGFIDKTLIPLILGIAFLMFVWGVFKFFILGGSDEEKQSEGKSLMIYAVAGFVLILSFYGIINVVVNGLGFKTSGGGTITAPSVPQPVTGQSYNADEISL